MEMTKTQAFNVLIQAVSQANKAGAFELKDSATVFAALGTLAPMFESMNGEEAPGPQLVEETPKKAKK